MTRPDVIIVGAGAAGLAAASELSAHGRSVHIIEARDRIGGRILTVRDPAFGMPVELGAEFIHGRPESTWSLIRRSGLVAFDLPFDHHQRRRGRLIRIADFSDSLGTVMGGLSRLRGRDMSFAEYLRRHRRGSPDARRLAVAFVQGFDAADTERISARSLAEEQEGLGDVGDELQFRLLDGYGSLIEHLRRSLDRDRATIALNTLVREVCWSRSGVEVRFGPPALPGPPRPRRRGRVVRAPRAIITLPLGVLQVPPEAPGSVRFAPEITHKRDAIAHLASGPVVKAVLKFREAFWEHDAIRRAARADETLKDLVFLHNPDAPFPTFWTPRPLRLPVVTAWAGGPKALALSGLSPQSLTDAALRSLAQSLSLRPARIASFLDRAHTYDWPADPLARGAYSYTTPGGQHARATLAEPLDRTLFFAGEATDTSGEASTVAGALASGERAAREVLESM